MSYPQIEVARNRRARRPHCGLLFILAALLSLSGRAQTQIATPAPAKAETVELPTFFVAAESLDRYAPGDSTSAARIRTALADTSASITVISKEFMTDIGAESILDATRYFSGMSAGRAAGTGGILDRTVIRGFENDGRTVDNFSAGFQANFDPQFIERLEVVKGPNSILAPTGTPGGSINVITKSPRFKAESALSAQVGQFDSQKVTFDTTGPLRWFGGDKLAYRIVGNMQDTSSYLPGRIKLWDLEAAVTWRISNQSQLTFKYFGFDWTEKGAVGAANTWGIGVDPSLPAGATLYNDPPAALGFTYDGKNGVTDWSTRKNRVNMLATEYTTSFGEHISMRFAGNWQNNKFGQDQGLPSVPNISSNRYNPFTGVVTPNQTWALVGGVWTPTFSLLWDPTKIARTATYIQSLGQTLQWQHDFAGKFQIGSVSLQPVAGWSYNSSITYPNFTKSAALPAVNLFAPDDNPPKPDKSTYTLAAYATNHNRQVQAYAFNRLSALNDRLFVTGGIARVWLDNVSINLRTNVTSPLKDNHDTYLFGVLAKPLPHLSVYYSYSTNATGVTANNLPLWRTGKQKEWGVKADFLEQRLTVTGAYYDIVQNNLTTPNPAFNVDPVNNPPTLLSDQTNKGYEIEVKGGLTKNISLVASYTSQKLRDAFGRRPRNIADETAGLLVHYSFRDGRLKGLGVFGGLTRQGDTAGETPASSATPLGVIQQVGFYLPAFTIYNAGASYAWDRYSLNLTIDNVFNHKGFWQAAGRGAVPPIPGTNVRLGATIRF
jgi:iron complex outermembrane receptor protein